MSDKSASRTREAGLRFLMKMLPADMVKSAPAHLEKYLLERLCEVDPMEGEAGACYLIAPHTDGRLKIMLVALDEESRVVRVISTSSTDELFALIMEGLKNI